MRWRIPVALLVAALAPARGQEWSRNPLDYSAAGRQFGAWLSVFNAGRPDELRRFLLTQAPSQYDIYERMVALRLRTGGFEPRKVVLAKDTRVTLLMQERGSDQFAGITLDVEPWAPHRITRLSIGQLERPREFSIGRLGDAELIDSVRARLADSTLAERFAGAVLIARNGRELFASGVGLADRERGVANEVDTRFRLGSMARMFTALAIMQLVQAGTVDVHASIATYLPDYPNRDVAARVTVHHLLTHTSGLGDIAGPRFNVERLGLRSLDDYLRIFGGDTLAFEPGTRWSASSLGYVILGAIVERVSGQSYSDYVRAHVFEPAGMTSSGFEPETVAVSRLSTGYTRLADGGPWTPNTSTLPWRGNPATGGYSTVRDLLRFANALGAFTLLDADYVDLLTTRKAGIRGSSYAYGFLDVDTPAGRRIGLAGGGRGMHGDFELLPVSGYTVIVLSNYDPPAARSVSDFILNRVSAAP